MSNTNDIVIADNNSQDNMMIDFEITKQQMKDFAKFKKEVLDKSDTALVKIGNVDRTIIKKSGWRKIQTACRLTWKVVKEEVINDYQNDYISARYIIEVTAPAGRSGQGVGACDSREKQSSRQLHDIVSIASTRALNRAISDFVGMGELVYAELEGRPTEELNQNSDNCNCSNSYVGKDGAHCADCGKPLTNAQRNSLLDAGKTYEFWQQYCHCRIVDIESKDNKICDTCHKDLRPNVVKYREYKKMKERDPK